MDSQEIKAAAAALNGAITKIRKATRGGNLCVMAEGYPDGRVEISRVTRGTCSYDERQGKALAIYCDERPRGAQEEEISSVIWQAEQQAFAALPPARTRDEEE